MAVTPTTAEVLGRKLHVLRGGEGPPLLYLHSAAGEAVPFFPFYAELARSFDLHVPAMEPVAVQSK